MKNAKKIFGILFAIIALALVMSISIFAQEYQVGTKPDLDTAYANANAGDTIKLTADITITSAYEIGKAITLDLGGKTLTASSACAWGALQIKNGASLVNGTLVHQGKTCAIKVWNGGKIEDLVIECTYDVGDKVIGGIVFQKGDVHLDTIKNVEIKGVGLTNGIETYCCGNATNNVVDLIENVKIDANGVGIWTYAPIGVVKNSTIHGDVSGVSTQKHATDAPNTTGWRTTITLQDCDVSGDTQAILVDDNGYDGITQITADLATTLTSAGNKITLNVTNADSFTAKIAGFIQNTDGTLTECTTHVAGTETYRVEPKSTTENGSLIYLCSSCGGAAQTLEIKLYEAANYNEFNTAYGKASTGDVIRLTGNVSLSAVYKIEKAIIVDLNGKTITASSGCGWGALQMKNGCSLINGTIVHHGKTCAIKAWNVDKIENVTIECTYDGSAGYRTIGGIVMQESSTVRINTIKNVTIKGVGLTNGIETYNCGNASEPVIGLMENVTIDATGIGMWIYAPIGTVKNCSISGDVSGVHAWAKGDAYSTTITFENCNVEGGSQGMVIDGNGTKGTISITADNNTIFTSETGKSIVINDTTPDKLTVNIPSLKKNEGVWTVCAHTNLSVAGSCTVDAVCADCQSVLGKVHNYQETGRVASSCTVAGYVTYSCSCGATDNNSLPYGDHSYDEGVVTAPTCTDEGYTTYTCTTPRCDRNHNDGNDNAPVSYVGAPVDALGHDIVEDAPAVPATCTQTGLTNAEHCTRTGCTYATTQEETDELGHDIVADAAVPATCTQTGLTAGEHCSRCDDATVAQTATAALGHDIITTPAVAPTCIFTGLTEGKHCSRCDGATVTQTVVAALGHDIITTGEAVAPTCTETGLTKGEKCSRCAKATIEQKIIPALGHTWVDATLEAPKTCSVCAATEGDKLTPPPVDDGLPVGAIIGIVAGAVAVLGGGGFALYWFVFRKRFI